MKMAAMVKICLALIGLVTTMHTFAALVEAGVVKLQGTIYSATCTVTVNDQALIDGTPVVNMGRYPSSIFSSSGAIVGGGKGNGQIKIAAQDCPDQGTIELTFDGNVYPTDNRLLQLDAGENTAKNLGIALYRGAAGIGERISFNKVYPYKVNGDKNYKIDFIAAYISTEDVVVAGLANSTLNVNLAYK
ncbi:fimbrial protein [Acinetobacter pullicarnis]|uniref:fimbrial protein n=1 Tax=Acinetobacter pullicarnis TaxID=2576829 RepID=UPI001122DEDF|nr:fimbrial protein [Acinetobacter pullicarnis]